jgi:predicted nucleotidyltransferase component of viral defense system
LTKPFLSLSVQERADILNAKTREAGLPAGVLEKDVWICWLLKELFEMPRLPMVFKGGTSLSKVYGAIKRMSEDLDITIDTRTEFEALAADASKSQRSKRRADIETFVTRFIDKEIRPHLLRQCVAKDSIPWLLNTLGRLKSQTT